MSEQDRAHGAAAAAEPLRVSAWVARFLPGIVPGGAVLDVACGSGRNLRAARARGHPVTGVDRDLSGVTDLQASDGVRVLAADLETGAAHPLRDLLQGETFAAVVVTNYLWRPILPDIVERVADDGVLIYETFAVGNERVGRGKPSNPDFLLNPGELLETIRPRLVAIAYEHATMMDPERVVQRIAAVGPGHPWLNQPPASLSRTTA